MTDTELAAIRARFAASQQPPWYVYLGGNPAADVGMLLAEVERLRAELTQLQAQAESERARREYDSVDAYNARINAAVHQTEYYCK